MLSTFRPEKALNIADAGYTTYLEKLGVVVNETIRTIDDLKQALAQRVAYFAEIGCPLSDHSFGSPDFTAWDEVAAEEVMRKTLAGEVLAKHEVAAYQSLLMDSLGEQYADHDWAMQLHMGGFTI